MRAPLASASLQRGGTAMRDLVIVGGGPAGLAAAAYALHLRLDTVVAAPNLGG